MKTRAAVAFAAKQPLEIVELDLEGPKAGEVLVEIMATGICHTDAYTLDGLDSEGLFPSVLGHEGAGIVREVGAGVTSVILGDHVIPLYTPECRQCKSCLSGKTNLCTAIRATQGKGLMPDGSSRFSYKGQAIHHYMGCSTFSNFTVLPEIAVARIRQDAPFKTSCYVGCGVTTGIGAVVNTAKVQVGDNVVVFGLGGIGLNVIQGARLAGAGKIVGAGHGGAQAALALRQQGFAGSIVMIGREPEPPYERPPLSKEYLAREKPFERLYIRPPQLWADKQVTLRLATSVSAVDPAAKSVALDDGSTLGYRSLIWAAGGDPRRLACEGASLAGTHAVRTRADVDQLIREIDAGAKRVVLIGGGYIGLEAAAVLTKLGLAVTLLEALPRVLARVAGEDLSAFYEAEHRAHGVDLRTEVAVECIEGDESVTGVRLADGTVLPCEIVIVGIGIVPAIGPLIAAGAAGGNGVDVDEFCRTSLPDVFAIGDCAAHSNGFAEGAVIRLESVQNANDMATTAARAICGELQPYKATPWFWSNQYDLRLQTVGLSTGHDATVLRGDPAARSFSVVYLKGGRVIALDCVNAVKDYVQGRKLVENRTTSDAVRLADVGVLLKELV